jgi:hypothetical protein
VERKTMVENEVVVKAYQKGNEEKILPLFNQIFQTSRSLESWQWKFTKNPYGGPYISIAWYENNLAAHYAAYPVPISINNKTQIIYQVGDTFTVPTYRKKGHGTRSVLARVVAHFHQHYCEQKIPFFFGFNRGNIQKLGKMFLNYESVAPVYEWVLDKNDINRRYIDKTAWKSLCCGYSVSKEKNIGKWADSLFSQACPLYGTLIERNSTYLQWRYDNNPEYDYDIFLVKQFGRPIAWCICYLQDDQIVIGDVLFSVQSNLAIQALIVYIIKAYQAENKIINKISGWFSEHPKWWVKKLQSAGFVKHRQQDKLDLIITTFSNQFDKKIVYNSFYFTKGDSDLF